MDYIVICLVEILLSGLFYLKVELYVWGEFFCVWCFVLVVFISKENLFSFKVQVGVWMDGKVIYINIVFCFLNDEIIEVVI